MKKINKIILFLLILLSVKSVIAVEVINSNSEILSCDGANVDRVYYISGNNIDKTLLDMFWTGDDRLISDPHSSVTIWSSDLNLLSGCNNQGDWVRMSSISPGNNEHVIAVGGNCIFNKPTNNNNRTLQFVYNIGYYDIISGNGLGVNDRDLNYFLDLNEIDNNTPHTISYTNVGFDHLNIHTNECYNIELRYCGDGILDSSEGETCDDGNNINGDGCSTICEPEVVQSCTAGTTTGVQQSPINSNTTTLCQNGIQSSDFSQIRTGNTMNYSWSCGGISGGNCSASYSSGGGGGDPCITGGVTGVQNNPITIDTPNLCRTGENPDGFEAQVQPNGSINYLWTCGDTEGGGSCLASYSPGGGGGGDSCINGGVTGVQNSRITIDTQNLCRTGEEVGGFEAQVQPNGSINYLWTCDTEDGGSCNASYIPGGGGGGAERCGDGIVQRPSNEEKERTVDCSTIDDDGNTVPRSCIEEYIVTVWEECDFGNLSDRGFCNRSTCKYSETTFPGHRPGEITIPNGGIIEFGPVDNVIIGEGMNPYVSHSYLGKPYIRNLSDYDMYFNEICVVDKIGTTLLGSTICESLGNRVIKSNETIYFSTIPNFIGSEITSGNYGDNQLVTTIKHNGNIYDDAYFIGKLDVRVAKSSVATTGGGTSYISDTSNISNISDVADNGILNPDENKNFIGVGISGGDISSYTDEIDDTGIINIIEVEGNIYSENINELTIPSGTTFGSTTILSDFENYNGISNVFILKNKNFIYETNVFSGLSGARTYIIDNGNFIINSDIDYPDNIAFVVKGGNIEIDKSVYNINGTFITIRKDGVGGKFIGIGGNTANILKVKGSLYGNINELISERTYIKDNGSNQIDVGTIVSFGSSLFRKPAPLLSTFINEYLNSEKIAK